MRNQVQKTIRRFRMISPGQRIVVACSGGPDSTALLLVLEQLSSALGCTLSVVHFNHRLRGEQSDQDERFVRDLAAHLRLPVHAAAADIRAQARHAQTNLEETGRRLRYEYFHSLLESRAADRVAVGHTVDDQAETVLHRFLRGAGSRGLAAIYPTVENWLIRPLLGTRRQEVLDWLRTRRQTWRQDPSNQDLRFTRNRIRHQLLPFLAEFNPAIVEVLAHSAEIARDEETFWAEYLKPLVDQNLGREEGRMRVEIASLNRMPPAVARRFLRYALQEAAAGTSGGQQRSGFGGATGASDFGHTQRLLALAHCGRSGAALSLPGGIRARREFSSLLLETSGRARARFSGYLYQVQAPGTVAVPEIPSSFAFELIPFGSGAARYNGRGEDLLDRRVIQGSLVLRNWRAGDAYQREGHRRSRKIKELFQRWHVSSSERQRWPVVVAGDQIVWSRGWGIAEGCAPRPGSKEALRIREMV